MTLQRWLSSLVVTGLIIGGVSSAGAALAPERLSKSGKNAPEETMQSGQMQRSLADAAVTAVIGDFRGVLDKACTFVDKVSGSPEYSQRIRGFVDAVARDPGLKGMPAGSGLLWVVFPDGLDVAFVQVTPDKIDEYAQHAQPDHRAAKADGLLVVSSTDKGVSTGLKMASEAAGKLSAAQHASKLQVTVPLAKLSKQFEPQIRAGITGLMGSLAMAQQMMAAQQGGGAAVTTATARMLQGEMLFLLDIAGKVETLRLTIDLPPDGVRIDKEVTFTGKPASIKAESTSSMTPDKVRKMLPGNGAMRAASTFDMKNFAAFLRQELATVLDEMNTPSAQRDQILALIKKWGDAVGDAWALNVLVPGKNIMTGSSIMAVRDPNTILSLLEEMPEIWKTSGLDSLYEGLGIQMNVQFKKDVRIAKGVHIHQMIMDVSPTSGTLSASAAAMAKMMSPGTYNIAVVNDYLVYAMGDQPPIDDLITAAQSGNYPDSKPLRSQGFFGSDAKLYVDYGVGQAIAMMASLQQGLPEQARSALTKMAESVKEADPVQIAGYGGEGKYRFSVLVPMDLITRFAKAIHDLSSSNAPQSPKPSGGETTGTAQ